MPIRQTLQQKNKVDIETVYRKVREHEELRKVIEGDNTGD